jgi:two-component system sensor histidine kinase KdpD
MNERNPNSFLRLIRRAQRGKLKIYLGYCAGVGKTYQMLLEGRRLKAEGVDIVIGLMEPHGRPETERLADGLEVVPRRRVVYRGIVIEEMDSDAVLARRPTVALVDELAHTNAPGSRHEKRYQDVDDLLAAGIHVISTLNVQHLESLYDTVERLVSVKVRERVPDRVVVEADEIVNVDLTTEDLQKRLFEGKIYPPDQVAEAMTHFFQAPNLEQLRELTLREIAAQIDSKRRGENFEIGPAAVPDQVMVCLSSRGPHSDRLLRYASRLAGRLNRNWYAVYVQTEAESAASIDAATQRRLANTLELAHELGATVFTYRGDDVAETILRFAREYRVGHIVLGRSGRRKRIFRRRHGIVRDLLEKAQDMTIVVVDTREAAEPAFFGQTAPAFLEDRPTRSPARPREALAPIAAERRVRIWSGPVSRETGLRELVASASEVLPGGEEAALGALLQREEQGSTFLNEGVAFPHARLEGLAEPILAVGIARLGIENLVFPTTSAHVIFLFFTPAAAADDHVAILGSLSRLAQDPIFFSRIRDARDASDVLSVLEEWDRAAVKSQP